MAAWKDGERAKASLVARDESDTGNGEEGGDKEMASSKEEVAAIQKAEAPLAVQDEVAVGDYEEEEDDDEKIDETKDDSVAVRKAETSFVA